MLSVPSSRGPSIRTKITTCSPPILSSQVFVPNSVDIQAYIADNSRHVSLPSSNTTLGSVNITVSDAVKLWMYDKRYKNQIGDMLLIPLILSLSIPMVFEYLLPLLCTNWQRSNRKAGDASRRCRLARLANAHFCCVPRTLKRHRPNPGPRYRCAIAALRALASSLRVTAGGNGA